MYGTMEKEFFAEYPKLFSLKDSIKKSAALISGVNKPNKIMVCGNGGSASDSQHIVGELMKEFKSKRAVDDAFRRAYRDKYPADNAADFLQGAIPSISLTGDIALLSAVINDIGADYMYAQQLYGLGAAGDILIAISTSGNAQSVINAAKTANALGITTIGMTGNDGGKLKDYCGIMLNVPERETYKVQELHLPLYHFLCAAAEKIRFCKPT